MLVSNCLAGVSRHCAIETAAVVNDPSLPHHGDHFDIGKSRTKFLHPHAVEAALKGGIFLHKMGSARVADIHRDGLVDGLHLDVNGSSGLRGHLGRGKLHVVGHAAEEQLSAAWVEARVVRAGTVRVWMRRAKHEASIAVGSRGWEREVGFKGKVGHFVTVDNGLALCGRFGAKTGSRYIELAAVNLPVAHAAVGKSVAKLFSLVRLLICSRVAATADDFTIICFSAQPPLALQRALISRVPRALLAAESDYPVSAPLIDNDASCKAVVEV